jgi:pilus assembly protein CpaB
MNRRLLLILICALIGGAGASFLVYRLIGSRSGPAPIPTVQVVVAARDLQIGTLIGPADVSMGPWAGTLPKGALTKLDAALNRGAIANLYQGEPVMADRLAAPGSGGGLAAIIPPGMRASAVRVDEVVGLAGFVTPGMRVDVLMSGIPPGGNPNEGSRVNTLLQNIQVLSAGENLQKDSEGKAQKVQVVNLLVTPEQAEKLTLASSQTHIQLVLRNPLDTQTATPPGTRMSELFGTSAARPAESSLGWKTQPVRVVQLEKGAASSPVRPAYVPKTRVVEVFNGTVRTETKFTQENP